MPVNFQASIEIRDNRNGSWFWIHTHVWRDSRLTQSEKVIYGTLASYCNQKQTSFPSITQISKDSDISERHAYRCIKSLEKIGYLLIKRKIGKPNLYTLLKTTPDMRSPLTRDTGGGDKSTLLTISNNKNIIPKGIKRITSTEYGNKDVNSLLTHLKEKLNLPMLDGSEKENRRYCWLAIKKFGGVDKVKALVDTASQDKFWSTNLASFKKLYYNGVSIISKTKIFKDRRPQKQVIITSARPTSVESELARRKLAEIKEETR